MKSKDGLTGNQNLGMSRRTILKAASAAAAIEALGMPGTVAAAPPPPTTDYGPHNNLGPGNVYPLLAAWLILTTHGDPSQFPFPDSLGTVAGLGNTNHTIDYLLANSYNDTHNPCTCPHCNCDTSLQAAFVKVQKAFESIARHFGSLDASHPSPYGGGICPDKASVIQTIANL